ncbi:helix-turn-helix domain-containing protein [Streptomyces sp. WAC 06725]|uniref:helix-turn-helix domain-containing protein n=1 Tax=Streptomyces sp. WAC 06725 TaxID=2203209 RepID=UPI0021AD855C|nr:helix-turn-helix domain-containing protein [Streptomyces sp. WAC 06725]
MLRSKIVLACAEGLPKARVADDLGVSRETVPKWRSRFAANRLDSLADRPRSGPPRRDHRRAGRGPGRQDARPGTTDG